MNSSNDITKENLSRPTDGSGLAFATGFFFSARIIISLFSVRILDTEPSTGAGISLALNILLLALVCFQALGPGSRTISSILRPSSVRWVLAFLIFSCCSLVWSVTVSLPTSIIYWCGMGADVAIVVLLLRTGSVTEESHALMKGFISSTCCLALVAWIMPTQTDLRLGDETYFNTNQIGNLCAFTIFLAQYLTRRKDGKWGLATLFLAITLLRSLSKTTIVAFVLSESVLIVQDRSMSRKTKALITTAVVLLILVFWGLFEAYYNVYTTAGNQAETLTGRTAIWAYVLNAASEQPWIGHGFDSMWKIVPPFGSDQFEPRHAENELFQQFYAYGVVGIVLLGGLYGSLYRKLRRLQIGPLKVIFSSMILFIVIRGIAEAEAFDLLLPLWAIVLIATLVDREDKVADEMLVASSAQPEPSHPPQPISLTTQSVSHG
jgi:exopolysaccharide production protein ExoQ